MRFEIVALPDIRDGGFAHPLTGGHRPATPMGRVLGLAPQGGIQDGFDTFGTKTRLPAPSGSDLPEAGATLLTEALAP